MAFYFHVKIAFKQRYAPLYKGKIPNISVERWATYRARNVETRKQYHTRQIILKCCASCSHPRLVRETKRCHGSIERSKTIESVCRERKKATMKLAQTIIMVKVIHLKTLRRLQGYVNVILRGDLFQVH